MALVNIQNVMVLDNPTAFTNPIQFEITFECLQKLDDDLEWKIIYVGNAEDASGDQVLEEVMVGPVPIGINRFVLQAPAPDPRLIRNQDLIGLAVVLVTCSYMDHEFIRIGYYVNNEYAIPFDSTVPEQYPNPVDINNLYRNILHAEPRVTRFPIDWTNPSNTMAPSTGMARGDEHMQSMDDNEDVLDHIDDDDGEDDDEDEDDDDDAEINLDDDDDDDDDDDNGEEGCDTEGGLNGSVIMQEDSMDVLVMQQ